MSCAGCLRVCVSQRASPSSKRWQQAALTTPTQAGAARPPQRPPPAARWATWWAPRTAALPAEPASLCSAGRLVPCLTQRLLSHTSHLSHTQRVRVGQGQVGQGAVVRARPAWPSISWYSKDGKRDTHTHTLEHFLSSGPHPQSRIDCKARVHKGM